MSGERDGFFGFICFLTGAAIGAGLALLYAPQPGTETRKKIKDVSEKVADDVKENYERLTKEAKKAIEQVKGTAEKAVENVKSFIEGAKDGLKKEIKAEIKEEVKAAAPPKKKA
jgi:gas vesicle protein